MDLEERQRQRERKMLDDIDRTLAEAEQALAKASRFFAGEGAAIKAHLDALPASERAKLDEKARLAVQDLEREARVAAQARLFDQQKDQHRPANWRRLV